MFILILLFLVFHHTLLTVSRPTHCIHVRWAVDLSDPVPEPSSDIEVVQETSVSHYFFWIGFITWIVVLVLVCICLYPFRQVVWFAIQQRFRRTPRMNNDVELYDLATPVETEIDENIETDSSVLEGRNNTEPVQVLMGNVTTLVDILAMMAIQERDIGVTRSNSNSE